MKKPPFPMRRIKKSVWLLLTMVVIAVPAFSEPIAQPHPGGLVQELKQFALRGNVVDLAVAIVIGAAFNKMTNSLVQDIIMPPLGAVLGGVHFDNLYINLSSQSFATLELAESAGAPLLKYGAFIQSVVDFAIIASSVFFAIKAINHLKEGAISLPKAPPAPPEEVLLLREIRDRLKNPNGSIQMQ